MNERIASDRGWEGGIYVYMLVGAGGMGTYLVSVAVTGRLLWIATSCAKRPRPEL